MVNAFGCNQLTGNYKSNALILEWSRRYDTLNLCTY